MRIALTSIVAFSLIPAGDRAFAATPPTGLVPGEGSATFRFTTEVQTPKGRHSGSGTLAVRRTGPRAVSLTIQTDDGKPSRTIPLLVGVDGSVAPDPAASPAPGDATENAQAGAFMAEMTVAARVGLAARKSAGATSFEVPIKLTPVGEGTPIATQLSMSGAPKEYTGHAQGQTTTVLPQGGSLDPAQIAKTVGVAAVAHHAFTPAGRLATAVVMHHKRKEEKKAASGPLPDAISLNVTADLAGDRIREIRGVQIDAFTLERKPVTIQSTWSFTRVAP